MTKSQMTKWKKLLNSLLAPSHHFVTEAGLLVIGWVKVLLPTAVIRYVDGSLFRWFLKKRAEADVSSGFSEEAVQSTLLPRVASCLQNWESLAIFEQDDSCDKCFFIGQKNGVSWSPD